jgi:GDPmannose 4,6-dehydratase
VNYREAFDLFATNGILFNHESPRRGETFVTRKITRGVGKYVNIGKGTISLGNLDAIRDWGFAGDYVEAMWLMLQHSEPQDFVVATGRGCTVRDFVNLAFQSAGITLEWTGSGIEEKAINSANGETLIDIDPRYFRPSEVEYLLGDATKAVRELGWSPSTNLETLVEMMVESDIDKFAQ